MSVIPGVSIEKYRKNTQISAKVSILGYRFLETYLTNETDNYRKIINEICKEMVFVC